MKHVSNERGALPVLVVVLVVVLVAAVGVAVYNASKSHQQDTQTAGGSPSPASSPAANASTAPTPTPSSAVLVIKELGLQIPLSGAPAGLLYEYKTQPDGSPAALLGTKAAGSSCTGKLGSIIKTTGTIPSGVTPYYTTDQSGARVNYFLKQFNGYWVQHVPSQNPCQLADGSSFPDKATALATIKAVNGLEPTQ